MKYHFLIFLLGLSSIDAVAFDNKYQYENFLSSSNRGKYLQEQIDSNSDIHNLGNKKCEELLKFKQINNSSSNLQLQAVCKGISEDLHINLGKAYDSQLTVNTCSSINEKQQEFTKCGKSIR